MTRVELAHLDARYRALHKSASRDTERAFLDWRDAAVAYAEERRSVDLVGDLADEDRRRRLAEVLLDERSDVEVLIGGGVVLEPVEEEFQVFGHAPIVGQDEVGNQSRVFAGEEA